MFESGKEGSKDGSVKTVKRAFGFGQSAEVVLAAFFIELLVQVVVMILIPDETIFTWTVIIANQLIFFGMVVSYCKKRYVSFSEVTGFGRPPKIQYFMLLVPIAFLSIAAFAPIASMFSKLVEKWGYTYSPNYHIPFSDPFKFSLSLIALGILPALGEETLIRGALISGTKRVSPLFALVYSSAVFALFHGNAVQLVHQFLLGLVMGYVAMVTRSVWSGFTIHLLNNVSVILLEYGHINGKVDETFYNYFDANIPKSDFTLYFLLSIIGLLILLGVLTLLLKRDKEDENGAPYERGKGGLLAYLAAPSEKEKERRAQKEMGSEFRFSEEDEPRKSGEIFQHVLLIGILIFIVISGVVTEVVK